MNAKDEFIKHTGEVSAGIICALLVREIFDSEYCGYVNVEYILPTNYTADEYDKFLQTIDFEYDNGFGGQEIYGVVIYDDKSWSERGEYDGSEWWEYKSLPEIPESCRR